MKYLFVLLLFISITPLFSLDTSFYNPLSKFTLGEKEESALAKLSPPAECYVKSKLAKGFVANIQGSDGQKYTIWLIFFNGQLASIEYRHDPMEEDETVIISRKKEWATILEKKFGKFAKTGNTDFRCIYGKTEIRVEGQSCFKVAFDDIELMKLFEKNAKNMEIEMMEQINKTE